MKSASKVGHIIPDQDESYGKHTARSQPGLKIFNDACNSGHLAYVWERHPDELDEAPGNHASGQSGQYHAVRPPLSGRHHAPPATPYNTEKGDAAREGRDMQVRWVDGFEIRVTAEERAVTMSANREGMLSLARMLTDQADGEPGDHVHLDGSNSLEDGSAELVIERVP